MIEYRKHHQIDFERWDNAITNSKSGLVYALSWYLNIVSPGWEALIDDDYSYVMPLTVKRKYFVQYITQPLFSQQLGIFSELPVNAEKVNEFINAIPGKFIKQNINFNSGNPESAGKHLSTQVNYELSLLKSFEDHQKAFNENTRRNCKKAHRHNLSIIESTPAAFIKNFRLNSNHLKEPVFITLEQLMQEAFKRNICETIVVLNENNECVAGTFFIKTLNRIIYLVSFSTEAGKSGSAMFLVVEHIVKKYAKSGMILDFEGSMIPGIARFFEGFGAEKRLYPTLRK